MELIKIMDKEIVPVLYQGIPVLTLRQMDELHQRPSGTARRAFNYHKGKLVEGEDYFTLSYEEWSQLSAVRNSYGGSSQRNAMTFLTESGYLLLVKSLTDERSWRVQRVLVRSYFMVRESLQLASAYSPPRTIEVEEVEWYKMRAELAELKLKVATGATDPRRRNSDPDEDARIIAWRRQGLGPSAIGKRVGRSANSVRSILGRLKRQRKI
jgi:hypothetical protein